MSFVTRVPWRAACLPLAAATVRSFSTTCACGAGRARRGSRRTGRRCAGCAGRLTAGGSRRAATTTACLCGRCARACAGRGGGGGVGLQWPRLHGDSTPRRRRAQPSASAAGPLLRFTDHVAAVKAIACVPTWWPARRAALALGSRGCMWGGRRSGGPRTSTACWRAAGARPTGASGSGTRCWMRRRSVRWTRARRHARTRALLPRRGAAPQCPVDVDGGRCATSCGPAP